MIKETIEKLKGIIAQSDTGHLPLSCRCLLYTSDAADE